MLEHGFTLLEVIIVLALLLLILALSLTIGLGSHKQTLFENDIDLIVSQLYQARAAAMQNKNGLPHGIRIEPNLLTVFAGETYEPNSPTNQTFPLGLSPADTNAIEVVFQPLSGENSHPLTFSLTNGLTRAIISINEAGSIFD
jgi:prepilin-type N-terminal cleavage/methylation domain-containing protein